MSAKGTGSTSRTRTRGKAAVRAVAAALAIAMASAGTAQGGDDLKNIAIGTGAGILGQILRGDPITVQGAVGSGLGAAIGSQVGDGSGAAVASVIGGLAGDTLLEHAQGIVQGGAQTVPAGHQGAAPATGTLASLVGAPASVEVPVTPGVRFEAQAGAVQACEGEGAVRHCVPVTVEPAGRHIVVADGSAGYLCTGEGQGLRCSPLPRAATAR